MISKHSPRTSPRYEKGHRLHCETCGAEIEIVHPCTCNPPHQVLKCCGQAMVLSTGRSINLGDE